VESPPIYIGGESDRTLRRVVKHADGWLPRVRDPDSVLDGVKMLRRFSLGAGRDPDSLTVSAFGVPPNAAALARFRDAGVRRAVLSAPRTGSHHDFMREIDRFADLLRG
jgi:alkanesulfonate monooxygenase SsuD/methylene tetrahydromethanopterin reductase-like flavin-dependent oxidoreductase (luciferase family)